MTKESIDNNHLRGYFLITLKHNGLHHCFSAISASQTGLWQHYKTGVRSPRLFFFKNAKYQLKILGWFLQIIQDLPLLSATFVGLYYQVSLT